MGVEDERRKSSPSGRGAHWSHEEPVPESRRRHESKQNQRGTPADTRRGAIQIPLQGRTCYSAVRVWSAAGLQL
uniref:Uncharacterized protein n=1 Tax=Myotis myotis TaxID=51298 RepID=A0A7J7S2K5_MYOMY|nr:hypothetical protein mMyoMyo1_010104 [Myotis myotis]